MGQWWLRLGGSPERLSTEGHKLWAKLGNMTVAAREPKTATVWTNIWSCYLVQGFKWTETLMFCWLPNQTKLRSATALLETKSVHLAFHTVTLSFLASCSLPPLHNNHSLFKGMMVGERAQGFSMSTRAPELYAGMLGNCGRGWSQTCVALLDTES